VFDLVLLNLEVNPIHGIAVPATHVRPSR
jgi:hypothetical protein